MIIGFGRSDQATPARKPAASAIAARKMNTVLEYCLPMGAAVFLCIPFAVAQDGTLSDCEQAQHMASRDQPDIFQVPENALKLADCLGHEDPAIRDQFAYGTFVEALRQGDAGPEMLRLLMERLVGKIRAARTDSKGFLAPFSVLVLAEIARVDRLDPFMTQSERSSLARAGSDYLRSIEDYRGFDPENGWRHGVAHAADLLMQLSLNPLLEGQDARIILTAIGSQVVPKNAHSYIHGESKRLARPILYLAMTDLISADGWRRWFAALEADGDDPRWRDPYASLEGLARIHNTENFAAAVYVRASASGEASLAPIAEAAEGVVRSIP